MLHQQENSRYLCSNSISTKLIIMLASQAPVHGRHHIVTTTSLVGCVS